MLSTNQIFHRQFIASPIWKSIRDSALSHYGTVCRSCGEYGTDVHHKTYARFGGQERLEDLEVLCRSCHDAKHAIPRKKFTRKRKPLVHVAVAYRYLTDQQKSTICDKLMLTPERLKLRYNKNRGVMLLMRRMLSVNIIECNPRAWLKLINRERR